MKNAIAGRPHCRMPNCIGRYLKLADDSFRCDRCDDHVDSLFKPIPEVTQEDKVLWYTLLGLADSNAARRQRGQPVIQGQVLLAHHRLSGRAAIQGELDAAKADAKLAREGYQTAYAEFDKKCRVVNQLACEKAALQTRMTVLEGALQLLERAATLVHTKGAVAGAQWTKLASALIHARVALFGEKGSK